MIPRANVLDTAEAAYQTAFGVTLSSRVRLARNLRGLPFPDRASAPVRAEVRRLVMERPAMCCPVRMRCPRARCWRASSFLRAI